MKNRGKIYRVLFLLLIALVVVGCEKIKPEEDLLPDPNTEQVATFKTAEINSSPEANYLMTLITTLEDLFDHGYLNKGSSNALVSKIENAIKNFDKGNTRAAVNQLGALIHQIEAFVANGALHEEVGEILINWARNGILLFEGSFIDPRDGQEYSVVAIGKQIWMAENLRYLPEVSQPSLPGSNVDPRYHVYNYWGDNTMEAIQEESYMNYGVYYNWPAAIESCPAGWRLPDVGTWSTLRYELGGILVAGGKMKMPGYEFWDPPNVGADNSSGFSAIAAGTFIDWLNPDWTYYKYYANIRQAASWWSSSETGDQIARPLFIKYDHESAYIEWVYKWLGYTVRCIKD